jgi:NitT/TauT family transport system substrate-binding protein
MSRSSIWFKSALIVVVIALAALALYFWHGSDRTGRVAVGYLPITADLPLFVALEKGYFRDAGVDVEPIRFQTSNQVAEALVAGQIDATSVIALTVLFSVEANAPGQFRIFLVAVVDKNSSIHNILVRSDSLVRNLGDLKGRTIGVFPGSNYVSYTKAIMKNFLNPETELTIVQMRPEVQLEALLSGKVDAIFTLEPTGTVALQEGHVRVLSQNPLAEYIMAPFPTSASVLSTKFLNERPDVAKRYQAAIDRAVDFIRANENEARSYLPKYTGVSESVAGKSGLYILWKVGDIRHDMIQRYADLTHEQGDLPQAITVRDMFVDR